MDPPRLLSWRITFVLYLFFHLASSAAVVRKSALTDPGSASLNFGDVGAVDGTDTAPFVRPALDDEILTVSATFITLMFITTLTTVPTTIGGIPTFTAVLTTSTSTSFVPIETIIGSPPPPPPPPPPSHSHNPAVIAVPVTVGAIAVLSLILFVTMRRRRALRTRTQISPLQRQESFKEIRPYLGSESDAHRASRAPDIDTDGHRSSIISTRQLVISNQVNRAREKVAELEEISSLLRSLSNSPHEDRNRQASETDHDVLPPAAAGEDSVHDADSLGVQDKLERAIRQIEGLNNRIHELERQRRSSWALGRSDEPPPGYTEDPE